MKAMILAAGKGTRVRPLTYLVPKPMIPLLGRPVMAFIVDHLRTHGFTQIVVNTSHLAPQIEDYFRDGQQFGVEMAYSFEGTLDADGALRDAPLGSAGGLRRVQEFSGFFDSTFAVLCGDAIVDVDLSAALAAHRRRGAMATIITTEVERHQVSNYGIVVTDQHGRIESFQEKPSVADARSTCANTGIYLFEPSIFELIPSGEVFDIGSQLFPKLLAAGAPFFAVSLPFQWVDIGNAPDYWEATMRLLRRGINGANIPGREIAPGIHAGINVSLPTSLDRLQPPLWIGGSARIADGATVIGPASIGAGSIVESGAHIERSVIWDYTRVTGFASLCDSIVSGGYSVSRDGTTLPIDTAELRWAIDDARRAPSLVEAGLESVLTSLRSSS